MMPARISDAKRKQKMRVAVAEDVIDRILSQRLRGASGAYILYRSSGQLREPSDAPDQAERNCDVCAIGAIFLSYVRLYNGTTDPLHNYIGQEMRDLLGTCFGSMELRSIDDCFEQSDKFPVGGGRSANDRILAIMQNIVDHKGKFRPEVEYEIIREEVSG